MPDFLEGIYINILLLFWFAEQSVFGALRPSSMQPPKLWARAFVGARLEPAPSDWEKVQMGARIRLGMLTPSSNTVLEPVTQAMVSGAAGVSAHFSRFPVTEISLAPEALAQFDDAPMLGAARLLAHARVHVIGWNGTSAAWLGFDRDEALIDRIRAATGIPACTSMLALQKILARTGARRIGLVTPYRGDVQARIVENFRAIGVECIAERHLDISENFAFAEIDGATIATMTRAVAAARPDAIAVICTNMAGAPLVEALEHELGTPIYDTIATVVWESVLLACTAPAAIKGWGRLFADSRLQTA
jgi:maleate isomerase